MTRLKERLRRLDEDFFREPTATERRRLRVIVAAFVAVMITLLVIQLRDGASIDNLAENWPSLLPGLIPIVGMIAIRWARR